jgi:Transposase DDE domain
MVMVSHAPGSVAAPAAPPSLDRIEAFLTDLVTALAPAPPDPAGRGRPRVLPALALWGGLLVCVLRGWASQKALWRLLAATGLWHFTPIPVSDEAVYKRLAAADPSPVAGLFTNVTALLVDRLDAHADRTLAPFATEVFALDQTTLDPVARTLPVLRGIPRGDDRLLPGQLAGVFDVRRQLWREVRYLPDARQNEKLVCRDLVAALPRHSLLLCDLGYFAFAWFDDLTAGGMLWISRLREKTSYDVLHVHHRDGETLDALVWLGTHRADRAKFAVRLIQFRQGSTLHRYLTNVLSPRRLPLGEVARLYARRWDIELAVNTVKTDLGLHLLWSSKAAVILHQVWAVLTIAQLLQALRILIAATARVDPFDVSLPLLVRYLPMYAARADDPIAAFAADGVRLGFIRPSRRVRPVVPAIPPARLHPPPRRLRLVRTPRYARRKCDRRTSVPPAPAN